VSANLFPSKKMTPQQVGLLSAAVPSPFGDALGLLADAAGYAQDPSSLTPRSGLLSLAAMIPGIPRQSVFRAVGPDELDAIRKTGKIKSNLSMALPVEKHFGLTGFAGSSDEAAMYAKANMGNSGKAYVLEVKRTPDMRTDYPALPKMAEKMDELAQEIGTLQKTIAEGRVPAGAEKQFADWLQASQAEAQGIAKTLKEAGIPIDKVRGSPGSASLPYWMTPNAIPAENIQKVFEYGADGRLRPVSWR